MKYPHLFSPIKINGMMVRNRIVAPPIGLYFEEKALGGAGIVVCSHTLVEPGRSSFASPDEPYLFSKYAVNEAQLRIRRCHQFGAKASLELFHAGQYARVKDYAEGPVSFTREDGTEVRAMTPEMMDHVADLYAAAAKDAKALGFDMIFMHFGHGWLAPQFLSPLFNKRTDAYGGCFENRAKFPRLILERVRAAVGKDYPIDMRISAVECVEGSIDFEDTLRFIKLVEPLIDTVQISAGLDINHEGNVHMATTNFKEHMPNAKYAKIVKENVKIPVSVVGGVMSPDEAEALIASGTVDLVAFGRSFVADPDWPRKAQSGHDEDIIPCIRCLQCYHISTNRSNVGCSVNPRYCNESFVAKEVEPAAVIKRIAVVGGGPAGITAAVTAARRGHKVTLFESRDFLGGALHYVAMEHYKEDIKRYLDYLLCQLHKSDVDIRLHTSATPEMLRAMEPDAIFLATGSVPCAPPIKGIGNQNVIGFYEAIENESSVGRNVVIIGGGTIGAEIGLELAELGKRNVAIVEMTGEIAAQGNMLYRIALRQKLDALNNLERLVHTTCEEILPDSVVVCCGGERRTLAADTVIIATGVRANNRALDAFFGITPDTFQIGDCLRPRKIMEAVFDGHTIASHI
ncbi:MAG: FAD-dependent oxidoreductase [Oscillospiraceae bacterium]|nr:FAD-dependent oxidoreductase [Oscillospiraceae bacterium]